jgi:hypothetical protein
MIVGMAAMQNNKTNAMDFQLRRDFICIVPLRKLKLQEFFLKVDARNT